MKLAWYVLLELVYLAVVIGILSAAESRFETLVLAGLVQLYAVVLFNFSALSEAANTNAVVAFIAFRHLAAPLGITKDEHGDALIDIEKAKAEEVKILRPKIWIHQIGNAAVSLYALFKIVQAIL